MFSNKLEPCARSSSVVTAPLQLHRMKDGNIMLAVATDLWRSASPISGAIGCRVVLVGGVAGGREGAALQAGAGSRGSG
jgi:hypothetical protein